MDRKPVARKARLLAKQEEKLGIANTLAKYLLHNPYADTAAAIFDMPVERIRQIAADNGIVLK